MRKPPPKDKASPKKRPSRKIGPPAWSPARTVAQCLRDLLEKTQGRILFAFDFDGTLVGFHRDPDRVGLTAESRSLLRRLAKK